jgi:hypothetical protein
MDGPPGTAARWRWAVAGGCLVLDETGRCRFNFRRWWWHAPMHARGSKQLAVEYLLGPSPS